MANAATQARWRARASRKRIEINLPVDVARQLDALSRARNQSRAQYIASLIASAAAAANAKPSTSPAKPPAKQPPPRQKRERLATGSYRFRRPRAGQAAEQRHDWIAEYQGGLRVGLRRRPAHEYHRWRGLIIDNDNMLPRDALGQTRQEVMRAIVDRYLF